jgi:large subunit ribosomal protein L29
MKPSDIRGMSTDAIRAKLDDMKEELMKLRFQQVTGELTDYTRLRQTRRDIARLGTILKEREAAEVTEAAEATEGEK